MSFERWFEDQAQAYGPKKGTWEYWEDLGEVRKISKYPGTFCVDCKSCGCPYPISDYIESNEFDPEDPYLVCGGSPRCCP